MSMGNELAGMRALVTGAGSGIGQAIAVVLAAAGAHVTVTELPDRLERGVETVGQIVAAGGSADVVALDVRELAMMPPVIARAAGEVNRLDILVNNAGLNIRQDAFSVTPEAWDMVLDVNLRGVFFMAQAAGRQMRDQHPAGGAIINIASIMGITGYKDRAAYCASKAGVVNLSRVLAFEWAPHAIRVNSVCPTFVMTPMTEPLLTDPVEGGELLRRTPLGRFASPEDVARGVLYLASPAAAMVTGHALTIDGGWTAV